MISHSLLPLVLSLVMVQVFCDSYVGWSIGRCIFGTIFAGISVNEIAERVGTACVDRRSKYDV